MTTLKALPAVHDLPPTWDGTPVTWKEWARPRSTIRHHFPPEPCACGSTREPLIAAGLRTPEPGATFSVPITRRTKRGRTYQGPDHDVPAWPCIDLLAIRCRGCGLDTVVDKRTGDVWELDATDYGDAGSTNIEGSLW